MLGCTGVVHALDFPGPRDEVQAGRAGEGVAVNYTVRVVEVLLRNGRKEGREKPGGR